MGLDEPGLDGSGPAASGELVDEVRQLLPRHDRVIAATVDTRGVRTATIGVPPSADVEIGSISKGLTGLLYADACERGEVTPLTRLGDLLPLGDVPVADVTLGSLAVHHSGLPRLPAAARPWRRTIALVRHGTNPYGETLDELLEQARGMRVGPAKPVYSNVGFELLGHALAAAAGTTYARLVVDRLVEPLDLGVLYVPSRPGELRPDAVTGHNRRGRPRESWTGEGIGPAGGIRATVDALAGLTAALVDGTAPGIAALEPTADFARGVRIGAGWVVMPAPGRTITWHNGGTGGFRSWLGVDRDAGTGAVVVSARSASVDGPGFRLLSALGSPRP